MTLPFFGKGKIAGAMIQTMYRYLSLPNAIRVAGAAGETEFTKAADYLGVVASITLDEVQFFHFSDCEAIRDFLAGRRPQVYGSRLSPTQPMNGK